MKTKNQIKAQELKKIEDKLNRAEIRLDQAITNQEIDDALCEITLLEEEILLLGGK